MTEIAIEQAMGIALEHHRAGRLAEAEPIYRQVLARCPDHGEALHSLGVLAGQAGRNDAAIELIERAIRIAPRIAAYHSNLGEFYRRSAQWGAAAASLRHALALEPGLAAAYTILGNTLWDQGQRESAMAAYRDAIRLQPDQPEAHNNLGNALGGCGRLDEAIAAYRRAIALAPDDAKVHANLGIALNNTQRFDEAVAAFRRALAGEPEQAGAHAGLGVALSKLGRGEEAIAAYRRALALCPDDAETHSNLGNALRGRGQRDEAIASCRRAIALRPDLAEAHNNLGNALWEQGRVDEAIAAYHRALALQPDRAEIYGNLGNALKDRGWFDQALAAYRRAVELRPDHAAAHNNLGNLLKEQGCLDEALGCFRRAVEVQPDFGRAASNLVYSLHYHPDYDAQAILAHHRAWAQRFAEPLAGEIGPHANDRTPDRRLRIGFLSPDLRFHPVGRSLLPLFIHRDRGQSEFVCYSDAVVADGITHRLEELADRWHVTAGLTDREVADRIRADQIDILVDTTLHTAGSRLLVFARKPAPVQVTMLGPPATTGLTTIDYRLTDRFLDPPGRGDQDYTEQSIRLPHCFWCYQPPEDAPPVGALPAERNGFVTFGCLNRFDKVSRPALAVWSDILRSLPGARLVIQAEPGGHREKVYERMSAAGVTADRIECVARVPERAYLERYQNLDLSLDPFPYNGHTSMLDSLWMGVPAISLAGRTAAGRGGVSILSNLGLTALIARTTQDYVEIAVRWATDWPPLAQLRAGLRARLEASPLADGQRFAADVQAVCREIWKTWCSR
jgi:predicted O-linked N-acetylglucosamine transferase (SPINDLY family)